jgi:hypothetical protein
MHLTGTKLVSALNFRMYSYHHIYLMTALCGRNILLNLHESMDLVVIPTNNLRSCIEYSIVYTYINV